MINFSFEKSKNFPFNPIYSIFIRMSHTKIISLKLNINKEKIRLDKTVYEIRFCNFSSLMFSRKQCLQPAQCIFLDKLVQYKQTPPRGSPVLEVPWLPHI
jgi:hypothetical protein